MQHHTMLVSILVKVKLRFQAMRPSCDKFLMKLNYTWCYVFFMKRVTID